MRSLMGLRKTHGVPPNHCHLQRGLADGRCLETGVEASLLEGMKSSLLGAPFGGSAARTCVSAPWRAKHPGSLQARLACDAARGSAAVVAAAEEVVVVVQRGMASVPQEKGLQETWVCAGTTRMACASSTGTVDPPREVMGCPHENAAQGHYRCLLQDDFVGRKLLRGTDLGTGRMPGSLRVGESKEETCPSPCQW